MTSEKSFSPATASLGLLALVFFSLGCGKQVQISDEENGVSLTYDCGSFSPKVESADEMAAVAKEQVKVISFMVENEHYASFYSLSNASSFRERERVLVNYKCKHKNSISSFDFGERSGKEKNRLNKSNNEEGREKENDKPIRIKRNIKVSGKSPIWKTSKSVDIIKWIKSSENLEVLDEIEKEWGNFYRVRHRGEIGYMDKSDIDISLTFE